MNYEALKDLCDLHYAHGVHLGRWEYEPGREESCEEFLATMVSLAIKYSITFDKNLENYIEDEDQPSYYAMDTMGCELLRILDKKLLDILEEQYSKLNVVKQK